MTLAESAPLALDPICIGRVGRVGRVGGDLGGVGSIIVCDRSIAELESRRSSAAEYEGKAESETVHGGLGVSHRLKRLAC
jgi:hypothetical protein